MVKLFLTNHHPDATDRHVTIDIETGLCTFENKQQIQLAGLFQQTDFYHPLLKESYVESADHFFHYEYDDIEGLLYSAIFIYSNILHVDNPRDCTFKITASKHYQPMACAGRINMTIYRDRIAKDSLSISELEALVSALGGYHFQFYSGYMLNESFRLDDLPTVVNGDLLYERDSTMVELLKSPTDISRFELRYIDAFIRLGVYARQALKKGDIISVYSGVKCVAYPEGSAYFFGNEKDLLKLYVDAKKRGNISRFINHAPSVNADTSSFLKANISPISYCLNGITIIVYTVVHDIHEGEQLLVNYGSEYNKAKGITRFKINGRPKHPMTSWFTGIGKRHLHIMQIMARHGIKEAQTYLRVRLLFMAGIVVLFWLFCQRLR